MFGAVGTLVRVVPSLLAVSMACACAPTGEIDETVPRSYAPVAGQRVSDLRGASLARPPTARGCAHLDPMPVGPAVAAGPEFLRIAYARAYYDEPAPVQWVQRATPVQAVPGWSFWIAGEPEREQWCYIQPGEHGWPVICAAEWLPTGLLEDLDPLQQARVLATLDHAVRLIRDPNTARRCTPAPWAMTSDIEPPHVVVRAQASTLVFVEELRPRRDLGMLVRVEATYDTNRVRRTELLSWDPTKILPGEVIVQ